jgi:hypothetical protein
MEQRATGTSVTRAEATARRELGTWDKTEVLTELRVRGTLDKMEGPMEQREATTGEVTGKRVPGTGDGAGAATG